MNDKQDISYAFHKAMQDVPIDSVNIGIYLGKHCIMHNVYSQYNMLDWHVDDNVVYVDGEQGAVEFLFLDMSDFHVVTKEREVDFEFTLRDAVTVELHILYDKE